MAQASPSSPQDPDEPPRLRALRWLVIIMTITMIGGLITIVTLMIMTFMRSDRAIEPGPGPFPEQVTVPEGQSIRAVTRGVDWIAVVTSDAAGKERILILDPENGALRQSIDVQ